MRKYIFVLLTLFVLTLSGCNSETKELDKYLKNHYKTLESYEAYELVISTVYEIDDNETVLQSYSYIDNDTGRRCVANSENNPLSTTDYTVTCMATIGTYDGDPAGIVPYALDNGNYQVHPLRSSASYEELILSFMTDANIIEQNDENIVYFRTEVVLTSLPSELQYIATSGFETNNMDIPVILNAQYDIEKEMFVDFKIDNSDVMQVIYNDNFGFELVIESYYIGFVYEEYSDTLSFLAPKTGLIEDDHVNYFDDGDHYGYELFAPGDTIEGELEFNDDQDLVQIYVPSAGAYNLTYLESSYRESILFSVYSSQYELLYEGVIEETGHELLDVYLDAGTYYILLFSSDSTDGYKLAYNKVN